MMADAMGDGGYEMKPLTQVCIFLSALFLVVSFFHDFWGFVVVALVFAITGQRLYRKQYPYQNNSYQAIVKRRVEKEK